MDFFATPKSHQRTDDLEVTGISRSGRVRKKSSKLVDFESDDLTENKLKKQKAQQQLHAQQLLEKFEQKLQHQQTHNVTPVSHSNSMQHNISKPQKSSLPHTNSFPHQRKNFESSGLGIQIKQEIPDTSERHEVTSRGIRQEIKQEIKQEPNFESEDESSESESGSANGFDDPSTVESMSEEEVDPLLLNDVEVETQIETTGFTKLEPLEHSEVSAKNSIYMQEKFKKNLVIKDGKVIKSTTKTQRKDKGIPRFTAYQLWSKGARQNLLEKDPDLDFATISRKLGELWATVPTCEKFNWKRRAQRFAAKYATDSTDRKMPQPTSRTFINRIGNKDNVLPIQTVQLGTPIVGNSVPISPPSNKVVRDASHEPYLGTGMYKVTGTQPIDIAAHLTLLGESLTIIGKRLKEHEGQITVSGSLPLLLDSLLCALGPLLCLTQQIPEMNGANQESLSTILENVAYIMPEPEVTGISRLGRMRKRPLKLVDYETSIKFDKLNKESQSTSDINIKSTDDKR